MTAPIDLQSQPFINATNGGIYLDNGSIISDGASGNLQTSGSFSASSGAKLGASGPLIVSGTASFASGLSASSISAGGLNSSFSAGLIVSGGVKYDVISGGTTPTASSQSASSANTPITMTSGFSSGGPNIVYVQASGTSTASILLTPTSSASTSGQFQDGTEVTIINSSPSGSRLAIPSGNAGSYNVASLTISEGRAVRFKYIAALQSWIPLQGA